MKPGGAACGRPHPIFTHDGLLQPAASENGARGGVFTGRGTESRSFTVSRPALWARSKHLTCLVFDTPFLWQWRERQEKWEESCRLQCLLGYQKGEGCKDCWRPFPHSSHLFQLLVFSQTQKGYFQWLPPSKAASHTFYDFSVSAHGLLEGRRGLSRSWEVFSTQPAILSPSLSLSLYIWLEIVGRGLKMIPMLHIQ